MPNVMGKDNTMKLDLRRLYDHTYGYNLGRRSGKTTYQLFDMLWNIHKGEKPIIYFVRSYRSVEPTVDRFKKVADALGVTLKSLSKNKFDVDGITITFKPFISLNVVHPGYDIIYDHAV
jgi:hypothetical protein